MTKTEVIETITRSFARKPLPKELFWDDDGFKCSGDIPRELACRLEQRTWDEIKARDWMMIGVPPSISVRYLSPAATLYYIPSLIAAVLSEGTPVEFLLEAIIPNNAERKPKGAWWAELIQSATSQQRQALFTCFGFLKEHSWDDFNESQRADLQLACDIWYN